MLLASWGRGCSPEHVRLLVAINWESSGTTGL